MIIFLYLVFLCSNFLLIKSEDNGQMTINQKSDVNCTIDRSEYTFTEGQNVSLTVTSDIFINYGWWNINNTNSSRNVYPDLKTNNNDKKAGKYLISHTSLVDKSMEGTWEFKFYILQDVPEQQDNLPKITYDGHKYSASVCQTKNVEIVPKSTHPPPPESNDMFLIIVCVVGAILLTIIIAQAAYIVLLKNKARKLITLNTHNNLSKKTESAPNDTDRYCSNPGQKMMKVTDPEDDDSRDSVIYEAPNIEISGNARMPTMQPPQPPAITTMPRTPRPDHNMKIGPQAMLANFQRPKLEREISVANRPPLPLPTQGHPHPGHLHPGLPHPGLPHNNMFQEEYEEMETEENTYEPPPIINTMPPRLPMPPKKVPTGNLLDVKENTLKMRQGNKPLVTPKPQQARPNMMTANEFEQALRRRNNDTMPKPNPGHKTPMQQELAMRRRLNSDAQTNELEEALRRRNNVDAQTNELEEALRRRNNVDAQTNELEETLRRRNNVLQVPIVSIPDPSRGSPKPNPPPALKSKPRGPPVQQPVQEEIYYNDNQASSDEEWTYEPLKPLNSYDSNIYNV